MVCEASCMHALQAQQAHWCSLVDAGGNLLYVSCMASAGQCDVSDWNNALKLGFDPATEAYPDWLSSQVLPSMRAHVWACTTAGQAHQHYMPAAVAAGTTL